MNAFQQLFKDEIRKVTIIQPINHPIDEFDLMRIRTPFDALFHAVSVLSDVQAMIELREAPKQIIDEVNEAKYWITKVMEYMVRYPECPLRDLCPFYRRAKQLVKPRGMIVIQYPEVEG